MKILVTGSSGFLGTALCRRLRQRGDTLSELTSKICDLRTPDSLLAFNNEKYDQIFHLAAWTQAGDFCLKHPGEQWMLNQQINTNVLSWWQAHQPQAKLITIGTSCAYDPNLPLKEENYLLGTPIESLYTYAQTKRMMQVGLQSLSKQFGLKWLTLVPSTLYGPGYHTDGRQMHFIFDVIRKIVSAKETGGAVILWGDGYQKRELIHVDDFVTSALNLNQRTSNEIINIGAGQEHSIREFADLIAKEVGFDVNQIQYDTSKYVGARSKCLCIDKLTRLMPNVRSRPISESLAETIAWFSAHVMQVGSRQ